MNDELQKALGELLSKANNGIDTAGDFLSAELPDVISQLLIWHGAYSAAMCLLAALFCITWYYANKKQYEFLKKNNCLDQPLVIFNIIQIVLVFIPLNLFNLTWLQIWIAPKIFLIEYAAKLGG